MYKTLAHSGEFKQVIERSTFIARAEHIESEEEAQKVIGEEKKKYPDARHCCWAYILGEGSDRLRYSDDGEPQGTAGLPMLDVLKKQGITNTVLAVTRYFGGILLGTGGLTRAYSSSATGAIESGTVAVMTETLEITVEVDYSLLPRLTNYLKGKEVKTKNTEYLEKVIVHLLVRAEEGESIKTSITDCLYGKCVIKEAAKFFSAF